MYTFGFLTFLRTSACHDHFSSEINKSFGDSQTNATVSAGDHSCFTFHTLRFWCTTVKETFFYQFAEELFNEKSNNGTMKPILMDIEFH